ncbi:hypothetical protein BJ944DRAFT_262761 [Cunninghamella echinulata]|nr:hypothetical protein BJ944DRAFT_262761 [Cunninghamella echinulata]
MTDIHQLPYDVIVQILKLSSIDLNTILQFIEAFPQYKPLGIYVLKQDRLPNMYLQAITDQEGKRQYMTQFQFHQLSTDDQVVFIAKQNDIKKRYISNITKAARPQLKNITIHYHHQQQRQSCITSKRNLHHASKYSLQSSTSSSSSSLCSLSSSTSSSTASSSCSSSSFTSLIQSHSLSLKHGLHTIYPHHYKKSNMKWQYSYHVSDTNETIEPWLLYSPDQFLASSESPFNKNKNKEKRKEKKKDDMNISPLCITVPLSLLISHSHQDKSSSSIWYSKCFKVMKKCIPYV